MAVGAVADDHGGCLSWRIAIDGRPQPPERFSAFFRAVLEAAVRDRAARHSSPPGVHLEIQSSNTFPAAAGFASSASGFAALAGAVNTALKLNLEQSGISALARIGSGSASRSVYGGFVSFPRNAEHAGAIHDRHYWPELRCIIITVSTGQKAVSSRKAMEDCRLTSPYYQKWIEISQELYDGALHALSQKNIQELGNLVRQSYLCMFSTMFSMPRPLMFWEAESLGIIKTLEEIRGSGIPAFETMDAGPQVKVLTTDEYCAEILRRLQARYPGLKYLISTIGGGLEVRGADGQSSRGSA